MMMKAWASGHGKAAINAVMIDCLSTGQCHPSKPASLADNLREWHEKFLRQNTTLSRLDSIHCKTTTVIKPYCKKPGDNSHCLYEGTLRCISVIQFNLKHVVEVEWYQAR